MSETSPEKPAQDPEQKPDEKPATEQSAKSETDWKAEARKWEQRAKDNSSAAEKLAALEEAKKTELQKATERAEQAEKRAAESERVALRTRIAAEMNVPVEVLHGDDEESVKASAQRVLDWASQGKKPTPPARKLASGSTGADGATTGRERAAAALRQMRGTN